MMCFSIFLMWFKYETDFLKSFGKASVEIKLINKGKEYNSTCAVGSNFM